MHGRRNFIRKLRYGCIKGKKKKKKIEIVTFSFMHDSVTMKATLSTKSWKSDINDACEFDCSNHNPICFG